MSISAQPNPAMPNVYLNERSLPQSTLRLVREIAADKVATQPILTVIVVAYRHERYIEECLESINHAADQSIEVLIIDDGSPDGTLQKCLDFHFRPDINVRVYTKTNQGLVHSLFYGLKLARGRYTSFMASDDCYMTHGLDAALSYLQDNPTVDALLCQAETIGLIGGKIYGAKMDEFFGLTPLARLEAIWSEVPAPMLLQATVFDTNFLRSLHPWEDDLELDDWPMFIRVFAAETVFGAQVIYCPKIVLSKYRMHAEGSHTNLDRHLRLITEVINEFVPVKYRNISLANTRVDMGIAYCRSGRILKGVSLLSRAIYANAPLHSAVRTLKRAACFIGKRLRFL